jgi:ankyrin repeat protein
VTGNTDVFDYLISHGTRLPVEKLTNMAVNIAAAPIGNQSGKVVERLIGMGARLGPKTSAGYEAVINATLGRDLETARVLLANGASVEDPNETIVERPYPHRTPLSIALNGGDSYMVRLLLANKADVSKVRLDQAVTSQDYDSLDAMIEGGADLNSGYIRPLTHAAMGNMDKMAEYLIQRGANIHYKDYNKKTPLETAIDSGGLKTAELLLERGGIRDKAEANAALRMASAKGLTAMIKPLLAHGAEVNALGEDTAERIDSGSQPGNPPLILAVKKGREETALALLSLGADINLADEPMGWKPVIHAAFEGRVEIMKILLDHGADPAEVDDYGDSALFTAARLGMEAAMEHMLDRGADVNAKNINGWTLLIQAAKTGQEGTMRLLLARGAAPGAKTIHGQTAWDLAANDEIRAILSAVMRKTAKPKPKR